MNLKDQALEVLIQAPKTVHQHNRQSAIALLLYLIAAFIIFGIFAAAFVANQADLKHAVLSYFLPNGWHGFSEFVVGFFFKSQTKIVIASLIVSASMVLASVLLFPLKEYCSSIFEQTNFKRRRRLEFPIWLQALEEVKLFLLYLTMQAFILAIGYYPFLWTKIIASTLSILFLFFSFGLDLISPTLQRQRIKYSLILKLLSHNWLTTLLFGCIFSTPALLLAKFVLNIESLSTMSVCSIIIACNLLFLALAIPAGTKVAHRILPEAKIISAPSTKLKYSAAVAGSCFLLVLLAFHTRIAQSFHHKSQILKCEYDIQWRSLGFQLNTDPDSTTQKSNISFNLEISNPTEFILHIEDSVIVVKQYGNTISTTNIKSLHIDPGTSAIQRMEFNSNINTDAISRFTKLLGGWTTYLQYDIVPGIPIIIQIK